MISFSSAVAWPLKYLARILWMLSNKVKSLNIFFVSLRVDVLVVKIKFAGSKLSYHIQLIFNFNSGVVQDLVVGKIITVSWGVAVHIAIGLEHNGIARVSQDLFGFKKRGYGLIVFIHFFLYPPFS